MAIMDLKWVGWIPPVAIPNPDQPTLAIFWHIITSVPKWKVQNHLKFLFKDVFKNYVLNHFLNWKERESCSSTDATSVHIDHSIFAMGFIHIPEIYCNPLPPQMVCTNIRIEWKTLGCTHFPEICFHLPSIWHKYQDKKKIPEIWFHPPNVWHKYQDRIENVAFYAHHRNMFTPPRMFCTNIRIEWMFGFSCVFVSPPTHTHKFWQKYRDKMKNLGLYTFSRNTFPPPNIWHKYQDRIENVGLYTQSRNIFPPPKCLAQISW